MLIAVAWITTDFLLLLYLLQDIKLSHEISFLIAQVISALPLIGMYIYLAKTRKITPQGLGIKRTPLKPALSIIGLYFLIIAVFFILLIGVLIAVFIFTNFVPPETNSNQPSQYAGQAMWAIFLSGMVLAPIVEEILFRGLLFRSLSNNRSVKWAAIVSSLAFMAIHIGTPLIALPASFLIGLYLCWAYQKTGSIVPGIVIHSLHNGVFITIGLLL